jgi:hypothetical protein
MSIMANDEWRRVWQAVILRALKDAVLEYRDIDRRRRWSAIAASSAVNIPLIRDKARFWLIEDNQGFRDVCEAAGVDPELLRRVAKRILSSEEETAKARARLCTGEGPGTDLRSVLGVGELRDLQDASGP